jgi:hypothetical protein
MAALLILTTLVACGGDDDDERDAVEALTDDSMGPFCADFTASDDSADTPIDEVQDSVDLATAASDEMIGNTEATDAFIVLIALGRYVIDNDDGDGVATEAEVQAAVEEFGTAAIEDATAVVTDLCASG